MVFGDRIAAMFMSWWFIRPTLLKLGPGRGGRRSCLSASQKYRPEEDVMDSVTIRTSEVSLIL